MQARVRFVPVAGNPLRRSCVFERTKRRRRVRFVSVRRNPLRRSCVSSARNAGDSAICPGRGQSSAEIVRVERAKCRRERDCPGRGQPSAGIARVECAKCRRERDLSRSGATLCGDRACRARKRRRECDLTRCGATLCGDRACRAREMQGRVRFGPVRGSRVENWRLCSTTLVRRSIGGAGR